MKVVVNRCYGGFSISKKCAEYMEKRGSLQAKAELDDWREKKRWVKYFREHGSWPQNADKETVKWMHPEHAWEPTWFGYGYDHDAGFDDGYRRDDPLLVEAVEKLGEKASGSMAKLKVVEIPDGIEWTIDEYDGMERVEEAHRSW
jgi:hypothetical protein